MAQLEALQRKYAAAARTLAAQSRMLNHLKETVQEREGALQAGQVRI
jgi:flagellar hook-associated protein FlgK